MIEPPVSQLLKCRLHNREIPFRLPEQAADLSFSQVSKPVLESTQPHIQWYGVCFPEDEAARA